MKNTLLLTTLTLSLSAAATANVAANNLYTPDMEMDDTCYPVKTLAKSAILHRQLEFDKQKTLALAYENSADVDPTLVANIVDKAFKEPYTTNPEQKEVLISSFESNAYNACASE